MNFSDCYCFQILDVYKLSRSSGTVSSKPRSWSAISFRTLGESTFRTTTTQLHADKGSILYVPAGVAFSRESTDEELIIVHLNYFHESETSLEVQYPHNAALTQCRFQELYETWAKKSPGYQHRCSALLHTVLADLQEISVPSRTSYKQELIRPGVNLINSNFDDPSLSIQRIAGLCNISEEYFRKLYKETYGLSPHKAIMDKRILKSCHLLQSGYFSIEEAAVQSGFSDAKYFSTLFHKRMHLSPREYKKLYNN